MSGIKNLVKETPLHERRLEFRTYPVEENRLVVEGWLKDERFVSGHHWSGEPRPSGVVHWMCVRILVQGWPLLIVDAEAEMPTVPNELCPITTRTVNEIIGLEIVSGFSGKVLKKLGGAKGCTHLNQLIVAMGPVALQGYWTYRSTQRRPIPRSEEEIEGLSYLVDSCQLWKKDGPMVREITTLLEKQR
jgi:hypothetical protein